MRDKKGLLGEYATPNLTSRLGQKEPFLHLQVYRRASSKFVSLGVPDCPYHTDFYTGTGKVVYLNVTPVFLDLFDLVAVARVTLISEQSVFFKVCLV